MGLFDQSSSPLSTLMPKSQPFKLPDYSNAFKMNWQPQMNTLKFQTGLATMNSSDPITAMNGRNMVNESVNLSETNNDSQQGGSNPISWDQGFQAMSAIGSKIGGQAGQVVSGIGNIGTNIKRVQEASKAAKAGVAGAGQMKAGGIGAAIGAASDLVGSFMPQKTEYEGEKGDITQTMDSVYDGISDAAMSFGPVGMLVGGIMKGGALLGKGVNALGGGTDGMTSTDAILGSSFLNLTPLGLINGFGGKKADTITKDNEAFAQVGSSYTGSNAAVDDALKKSGKKYGLLSSGARKRANEEIAEAKRQQSIISDISSNALDRTNIRTSMSAINGNRRDFLMRGGYDQASIRVGRRGMSIELLNKARSILKAQKGSKLDPMSAYKNQAPKDWESIPNTGKPTYQEWVKGELDYYDNSGEFKNNYNLSYEGDRYYYRKKKPTIKQETPQHKNGGSIIKLTTETVIDLINPLEVPEFQNGGSINVIPDGALHARKHNMDLDGITEKGIPVISEKENGKIEQQAEIEKEEVIFRLEVTQKLEELEKKYYDYESSQKEKDEYALEAGKLITEELLHNTKDNAGLL